MTEPKRCIIFVPSDGLLYERMENPEGDWIYDRDHKIDLHNLTSQSSRPDKVEALHCPICGKPDCENLTGG